jgi:hypothetical protein
MEQSILQPKRCTNLAPQRSKDKEPFHKILLCLHAPGGSNLDRGVSFGVLMHGLSGNRLTYSELTDAGRRSLSPRGSCPWMNTRCDSRADEGKLSRKNPEWFLPRHLALIRE